MKIKYKDSVGMFRDAEVKEIIFKAGKNHYVWFDHNGEQHTTPIRKADALSVIEQAQREGIKISIKMRGVSKAMTKLTGAKTKLEKEVQSIVNANGQNYDDGAIGFINDVLKNGCVSGLVGELVYYADTTKFFKRHKKEITSLLREMIDETGAGSPEGLFGDKWDADDFFAEEDQNQNLLAWFAFEETAIFLAGSKGWIN